MREFPVGATATTFRIVDALREKSSAGVTELAGHLDLSKSAVHNHLATLERLNLAVNDDGTYRLSLRFLDLATSVREDFSVLQAGRDEIESLADRSGETASIVVPEFDEAVYAYTRPDAAEDGIRMGRRIPLHACAPGKAILSARGGTAVEQYLDADELAARTDRTITDVDDLRSELRSIRDRGLAFDTGEDREALRAVAAPVRDGDGNVLGAIAVTGPATRLSGKRLREDLPGLVLSHVKNVELSMAE
jgi:DNA-binding IclR family transcriptional regulator